MTCHTYNWLFLWRKWFLFAEQKLGCKDSRQDCCGMLKLSCFELKSPRKPQNSPGDQTPPRNTKDDILRDPKLAIRDAIGPDMARRTKEKSDPRKAAPCEYWSG